MQALQTLIAAAVVIAALVFSHSSKGLDTISPEETVVSLNESTN